MSNEQQKSLMAYCVESLNGTQEQPWEKFPDYFVIKNEKAKWFAIFMTVKKPVLKLEEEGYINILNVKVQPSVIAKLINKKGFLPAYHMSKYHWITILLDDTVENEVIQELISKSYDLVKNPKSAKHNKEDILAIDSLLF